VQLPTPVPSGVRVKVLAVSSGGGHWVQLLRLRPALEGCQVAFATTRPSYRCDVDGARFHAVPDSNNCQKVRLVMTALSLLWVLIRERPDVVISTGAAPGYFGIFFGRLMGARTIWLDSVANAEVLSLAGRKAGRLADLWLTQWPHLAKDGGPTFHGSVI
jgi:UDP-N-acetylglucosamine:LPS N-acetylglucosamine transferase